MDANKNLQAKAGVALLVIDVQRGLFTRPNPIYNAEGLLDNICALVERAQEAGAPVVYVQHSNNSLLPEGTESWLLHPRLSPRETDLRIHKRHGNSFEKTDLHKELQARGVGTVVITGLVTHGCVKASCEGAHELGYRTTLVQDGHSSFHAQAKEKIKEWNHNLTEAGVVELKAAAEVEFV